MKLYVLVSGHMLGTTDAAYLHGVFSSKAKAKAAAKNLMDAEIKIVVLDEEQPADEKDYHQLPGIRIV